MKARRSRWICRSGFLALLAVFAFGCSRNGVTSTEPNSTEPASNRPTQEPTYKPVGKPKTKLSMRLAKWEPFPGGVELIVPKGLESYKPGSVELVNRLFVKTEAVLTNEDIAGTGTNRSPEGLNRGEVQIFLTPAGRERLAKATRENINWTLAIFLDDQLKMAPIIVSEIPDGIASVTGWFTQAEATELAQGLVGSSGGGEQRAGTQPVRPNPSTTQSPVAAEHSSLPQAPQPHSPLLGVWVVESGEALDKKASDKDSGGMKIEFHQDKATWYFQLGDSWKSWDGTLRFDPTKEPKEIDLSQPNNPGKVAYGIYKIEGNKLTISMGTERPKTFEEKSWAKIVLRRD